MSTPAHPDSSMRAKLSRSTVVFLVGNLEATVRWYERLGFTPTLFPPGFAIVSRDDVDVFLQHADNYVRPDDPAARERGAWNVYIRTDDVRALFDEFSEGGDVTVARSPEVQPYGQIEFEVVDPNGYVLVFAEGVDESIRRMPAHRCRRGRRTARSFPLLPPPQKN